MEEIERVRTRFLVLQKRLKTERLFVKNEKEQLRILNEKVGSLSQNLFYLEWKTRQQWLNVDRLVWGGRANPSECSVTSRIIETAKFEDASNYLSYEDYKYGDFLLCLKENPRLIALILNYCDTKRIQNSTMQLVKLFLSSLYGNCIQQADEVLVLKILKELMILQVFPCEDLLDFFCGKRSTDNAFACVMTIFSGSLFSSKLYLTAALHGSVMQVIVDDSIFLDVEVSKALCRIAPKVAVEKFGRPGTVEAHNKTKQHMNMLHNHLIHLCKKFLKNLVDKVYCFPQSLCWAIGQLYQGMVQKMKLPQANAKALIGHIIMSYFICPAIINPEPYGINSDADISETARHNLGQVASILRSLALLECGLKDEKLTNIFENFDKGVISEYISALIDGSEKVDIEQLDDAMIIKCSLLISEHDLKTMIKCLLLLETYNIPSLNEEGFTELLDNLPTFPQHWANEFPHHSKSAVSTSLLIEDTVQGQIKLDNMQQLEVLRNDLNKILSEEIPILIIPIKMESDNIPGMLSEEMVLGKKDTYIPSFDIETTEKDQSQRTSTLMLGALRESLIDTGSNEDLSSGSETSSKSYNIRSKEDIVFSDEVEAFFGCGKKPDKSCNEVMVVNNLINIDDCVEETPKLPEKRHQRLSNDPKNLNSLLIDHPQTLNNTFTDINEQPLLHIEHSVLKEDSTSTKGNRNSSVSLFDGPGGINAILQGATVQSLPNSLGVSSNELENFWLPTVDKKSDPWGIPNQNTNNEENHLFENSFTSLSKYSSLPNKANYSVDKNYANYSETIQREVKNLKQNKDDIDLSQSPTDNKFLRKKSHGGWLKDKISSKINTGLTGLKHIKKYDVVKKEVDSQTIKLGTPLEASEESRKKTHSFSRNSKLASEDAGEAILAKYRSMASLPVSHDADSNFSSSPMSSHMEGAIDVCREELAIFDNEFKFSDAKKKLRMVLCTTDQITLPSKATSFDQLLLTMLQAKLAEAINLQDRFSVAQLHETLRSIKQLPQGSCDQLVTQLEAEYEERSKYISYLIKSKQGLLSTISFLEQLTTKLQRDKTICSKYFTTLAVRLFLETPVRKHQIAVFSQKFASNKMLDEKSALLNELLEELNSDILKDSTWKYCTDEQLSDAEKAIERAIISRIYKDAFYPFSAADIENDKIFHENIKGLANIVTLSHPTLQIPKMYQKEAPWPSAQTELLMINAYKTAADKLSCIHRCCITIMNLLSMASDKHTPGADDFVPVLVYVVLRANPPNLLSTKQYVNTFYETRLNGEEYYCWMQFCAAIEFIKTLLSSLLKSNTNKNVIS
ncbi:GTPase-activating protein and VPS9 domain-containing protein 1 isoform X2 [Hydra vulgaris]|uniref:GTPase-activating protein and VPS9 domain-containing protein 1 isoform X2 n=1 Tax=Hydra vulgaris TaxID=6087 RepID=A0ABM4BEN7_HYDVU